MLVFFVFVDIVWCNTDNTQQISKEICWFFALCEKNCTFLDNLYLLYDNDSR